MRAIAQEAIHQRNQDPEHHESEGSGVGREQEAECGRAYCSSNDLPFAFILFRDGAPQQGSNGKSERDEKRDLSTSRCIAILRVNECWQPVSETVESYRLKEMEDCQHDGPPAVWRSKYFGETCLSCVSRPQCLQCGQPMAKVYFCMLLENGGNEFCIFQAAVPGEPT